MRPRPARCARLDPRGLTGRARADPAVRERAYAERDRAITSWRCRRSGAGITPRSSGASRSPGGGIVPLARDRGAGRHGPGGGHHRADCGARTRRQRRLGIHLGGGGAIGASELIWPHDKTMTPGFRSHPDPSEWDDFVDYESTSWPKKDRRNYWIIPSHLLQLRVGVRHPRLRRQGEDGRPQDRRQPGSPGEPRPDLCQGRGHAEPARGSRSHPLSIEAHGRARTG